MEELTQALIPPDTLVAELRQLIADARSQATATVNAALVLTGRRPHPAQPARTERAGYGERIVATVSQELVREFGRGFEHRTSVVLSVMPPCC